MMLQKMSKFKRMKNRRLIFNNQIAGTNVQTKVNVKEDNNGRRANVNVQSNIIQTGGNNKNEQSKINQSGGENNNEQSHIQQKGGNNQNSQSNINQLNIGNYGESGSNKGGEGSSGSSKFKEEFYCND
jgi:hypothetical protein